MTRLQEHGLSFEQAFCNSCMCSPSRASLFTGYFPAQHEVTETLSSAGAMPATMAASWRAPPVQDHVVFTYDDLRCAQSVVQLVPPPNRIVSVREARYKLARYYDCDGVEPDQWEVYDLHEDPEERTNLANPDFTPSPEQAAARERLTAKLTEVTQTQLQPLLAD